jgi:hypothetical protein
LPDVSNSLWQRRFTDERCHSSPWTGGADILDGGFPAALAGCGELITADACCCAAWLFRARRARDDDADRRPAHEREIEGPAVYPINAPATAPTGPKTTAPDTAPSAASPARSWALASSEINDPAIKTAKRAFFIVISPGCVTRRTTAQKCGGTEVRASQSCPIQRAPDGTGPQQVFPCGVPEVLAMMTACQ